MGEDQTPLRGHVPVPTGGEQTDSQKLGEGLLFSFLNVAANEVSVLGSILSEARLHRARMLMERRLLALTDEWKKQMRTVKEEAIDWEFVRSEAFIDLVRQAAEVATRTRDQQKIELAARVLRGAAVEGVQGGYSPEEYLGSVSDLTPKELTAALSLYEARPEIEDEPWKSWEDKARATLQIDESDLSITLSRIASSGLIEPVTFSASNSGIYAFMSAPGEAGYYRITPAFEKLMLFLFPADREPNP